MCDLGGKLRCVSASTMWLATIVISLVMSSCTPEFAKGNLDFGRARPDFRFVISLHAGQPADALFVRIERLAVKYDYAEYEMPPVTLDNLLAGHARSFDWRKTAPSAKPYTLSLFWEVDQLPKIKIIKMIMYHKSMDRFTRAEWDMFYQWRDEILPEEFPDATIEVTRHPAIFTTNAELEKIATETDYEIPIEERPRIGRPVPDRND